MDQHLTFGEALAFTGKSKSTLRRLLREIASNPQHPDRLSILPSVEEVERRKAAGEPYVWKMDRQFLLRRFPADDPKSSTQREGDGASPTSASGDLMLQILRDQLQSKDQQIRTLETQLDRKDAQISDLNSRMQEFNVLMRELQQKLALPFPVTRPGEPVVESSPVSPPKHAPQAEKPIATTSPKPTPRSSPKPASKVLPKPTKQKRGFFRRLFRRSK